MILNDAVSRTGYYGAAVSRAIDKLNGIYLSVAVFCLLLCVLLCWQRFLLRPR